MVQEQKKIIHFFMEPNTAKKTQTQKYLYRLFSRFI